MKRIAVFLALAASLAADGAQAQLASGGGPMDVTADQLEIFDAQKVTIWKGNVDALQGENRMLADQLNVYFSGKAGAKPSAPPAGGATGAATLGKDWGDVQRVVADGHVFFVSPQQTARGEHAVYDVVPDTMTLTGNVVVVQGENVLKGDTMTIQVKTGHATVASSQSGRNKPERVRGVFYSEPAKPGAAAAPGAAGAAPKAGAPAASGAAPKPAAAAPKAAQ